MDLGDDGHNRSSLGIYLFCLEAFYLKEFLLKSHRAHAFAIGKYT